MTAFYMLRLMGMTFCGESRVDPARRAEDPRVAAWQMTVPLILLAIPSVFLGMALGLPLGDSHAQAAGWSRSSSESEQLPATASRTPTSCSASTAS